METPRGRTARPRTPKRLPDGPTALPRRAREWYTPAEAAEAIGMDRSNLAKLVRQGRILAKRTGQRAWHLSRAEVMRVATWRTMHPGKPLPPNC